MENYLKNMTALYVEDDPKILNNMVIFLQNRIKDVVSAQDGEEGLQKYKQFKNEIDFVITDIRMPRKNGIEMIREIREMDPHMHCMITTAYSESDYFMDSIEIGIDYYLLKPINVERFNEKLQDLARKIHFQRIIEEKNNLLQDVIDYQNNMIFVMKNNKISFMNKAVSDFFDIRKSTDIDKKIGDISSFLNLVKENKDSFWSSEDKHKNSVSKKISLKEFDFVMTLAKSKDGNSIVTLSDISQFEEERRVLEKLANTDFLTKIYNRQKFVSICESEFEIARRYKHDVSFILLDIDYFKKINDDFGHNAGDDVLRELSMLLKSSVRKSDIIGRWGGEEFTILLSHTNLQAAINVAENLRKTIESHPFADFAKNKITVTCSFGVTMFQAKDALRDVVKRSDIALYKAKECGRNRVETL